MERMANLLILFVIISSVVAPMTEDEAKLKALDGRLCPPFGKQAKFDVETIQTRTQMFGCAYMGNESLQNSVPLFHLWLERPWDNITKHGHCNNLQNMDHFKFECLSKDYPPNKDEYELGWRYISLLEHSTDENLMQNKTKTRTYRCALYDMQDQDDKGLRIIRIVISKPETGDTFNATQCQGLSNLLARDELPYIHEGSRYWPDGSMYLYLLGRKAKIFFTSTETPEVVRYPIFSRYTTSSRPSTTSTTIGPSTTSTTSGPSTTTSSRPSTTTTTSPPTTSTTISCPTTITTTTTTEKHYYSIDDFFYDFIFGNNN